MFALVLALPLASAASAQSEPPQPTPETAPALPGVPAEPSGVRLTPSLTLSKDAVMDAGDSQAPRGQTLDLAAVLRRVWETHPEVDVVRSELDAVKFDIAAAKTGYYPYAQIQTAVAEKQDDGNSTMSIVQPLWDGGFTRSSVRQARATEAVSQQRLSSVRLDLSEQVLTAYLEILGSKAQISIWDRYIEQLQGSLQTIARRAEQGVAPDADVQTAVSRLRQAEAGRESSVAIGYSAEAQLASLMTAAVPALRWPAEATLLSPEELVRIEDNLDEHPNLRVNIAEIEGQKAAAAVAKASMWPVISLQHREQVDGVRFDPSSNATLLVMQYQSTNGLKAFRGSQAEDARIDSVERRADATRALLTANLQADKARLVALALQLKAQDAAAQASGGLVESYKRQFDVGRKTWVELLNAQREAHESRLQAAVLRRNYWQTNSRLILQSLRWEKLHLEDFMPEGDDPATRPRQIMPTEIPVQPQAPTSPDAP